MRVVKEEVTKFMRKKCDNCGENPTETRVIVTCGNGLNINIETLCFCSEKCAIDFFKKNVRGE